MTLTEIAQYAGEKIGKTDADTLTFLQKSASLNYRRVWNFAPWRETVTTSTYAVTAGSNPTRSPCTYELSAGPHYVPHGANPVRCESKAGLVGPRYTAVI